MTNTNLTEQTIDYSDFNSEINDLDGDVSHINFRLDEIKRNILLLQTNIDVLTQKIMSAKPQNAADAAKLTTSQSELLRTLSWYNDNYQKLLDLKFKYRSQKNDFKLKLKRLVIDSSKKGSFDYSDLTAALRQLSTRSNSSESLADLTFEKDEEI